MKIYCKHCGEKLSSDQDNGYCTTFYCDTHPEVKVEVKW